MWNCSSHYPPPLPLIASAANFRRSLLWILLKDESFPTTWSLSGIISTENQTNFLLESRTLGTSSLHCYLIREKVITESMSWSGKAELSRALNHCRKQRSDVEYKVQNGTSASNMITAVPRLACSSSNLEEGYYLPGPNENDCLLQNVCMIISHAFTWKHDSIFSSAHLAMIRLCNKCSLKNTDASVNNLNRTLAAAITCKAWE